MLRLTTAASLCVLPCVLFLTSCGSSKKPVVIGSKGDTEQLILGEIVAQHLERRLGRPVVRRAGLGGTAILYQSILSGELGVYPEYTGLIASEIFKEPADPDPQILLSRVRQEMDRVAQVDMLDPLGFDNPSAIVMPAGAPDKVASLSEAAGINKRWKLGLPFEFQSRSDGLPLLGNYRLSVLPRVLDPKQLFSALEKGEVEMIATRATDSQLTLPAWKVLADDRKVFPSYQACLLVRKDLIAAEPGLRPALAELSGKISADAMRKMNAEVDVLRHPLATVAADFLTQAGLK